MLLFVTNNSLNVKDELPIIELINDFQSMRNQNHFLKSKILMKLLFKCNVSVFLYKILPRN